MRFLCCSVLLVIIFVCAADTSARQSTCALKQAPELHGLRLGMMLSDVRRNLIDPTVFDSKVSSNNKVGVSAVRILGSDLKAENGEGVDDINLTFVDGSLTVMRVTYQGAGRWDSSQDFVERMSASLGLPKPSGSDLTRATQGGNGKHQISCTGFTVLLAYSYGVSPNVMISDTAAQNIVEQRTEKAGKVQKKTIGPVLSPRSPEPRWPN